METNQVCTNSNSNIMEGGNDDQGSLLYRDAQTNLCSIYLIPIMLSFLCSCGEHYNPFGRQHGGPEDSERVRLNYFFSSL